MDLDVGRGMRRIPMNTCTKNEWRAVISLQPPQALATPSIVAAAIIIFSDPLSLIFGPLNR
jgi:hypothetical protein